MSTIHEPPAETTPELPPQPPRHRTRTILLAAAGGGLVAILGAAVAIGATSHGPALTRAAAPATSAPAASSVTDPNGLACAKLDTSGYCPGNDPASTPASTPANLSGPLGTTYTASGTDTTTGAAFSYDITAVKVLDPAAGASEFYTPDAGTRFVGVKFTITGATGYSHDDANIDAAVQGSDGQVYQPVFDDISAGTNFNSGDFSVAAGQSQTGWVVFQVPNGVTVASVQWQPAFGGDQQPATWTTGS